MNDGPLYDRYVVTHKDGKPVGPKERFFVLNVDRAVDRIALMAFILMIQNTHPQLAREMVAEYALPIVLDAP